MKKILLLFIITLTILFSCTACSNKTESFVYYTEQNAKTLDPQLAFNSTETSTIKHIFSGLYRLDENGLPVQDMAINTNISDNGLVYTFELSNENNFYNNNTIVPVTAKDYLFGLQRTLSSFTNSPHAQNFFSIAGAKDYHLDAAPLSDLGIKVINDYTLEITLDFKDSSFLNKLASSGAMPCNEEFFNSSGGTYGLSYKSLMGNGNFYASAWSEENGITLRRITDIPKTYDRIRLVPLEDKTQLELLTDNMQDFAVLDKQVDTNNLKNNGYTKFQFESGVTSLAFNTSHKHLSNRNIRTAISTCAYDAVKNIDDNLVPATGLIPSSILIGDTPYRQLAGEAAAVSMAPSEQYATYGLGLTELGITKLPGIKILIPEGEHYAKIHRAINQHLQKELGAFFSVETITMSELSNRLAAKDFDIAIYPFDFPANNTKDILKTFISGNKHNVTGYKNPAYDLILNESQQLVGDEIIDNYIAAEKLLLLDLPLAPLVYEHKAYFINQKTSGAYIDPFGLILDVSHATIE